MNANVVFVGKLQEGERKENFMAIGTKNGSIVIMNPEHTFFENSKVFYFFFFSFLFLK